MSNITLPCHYKPRDYQLPLLKSLDSGYKRAISCWHRRSGKDKTHINVVPKKSAQRIGTYYYYFPTQSLARKIIWNGMDKDGFKFMDHFPKESIKRISERDMLVEFVWGSVFQIIGTDQLDVVGTNPIGCIFSEYSLQNPKAWQYIQPILNENDGWAIFNFTPRGHNHAYELMNKVKGSEEWFTEILTILDTGVVDPEKVENDIRMGLISREMAMQEYYCSFDMGVEGSYYTACIAVAEKEGRIGKFPVNLKEPVYTFWDLGQNNATSIWFAQFYNDGIYVIDHIEDTNKSMGYWADQLREKGYDYGNHYAPWDVVKHESNAMTVQRNAEKVGIFFERVKRTPTVADNIELVRRLFVKIHIDEDKCRYGITCLRQHHQQSDKKHSREDRLVFMDKPEKDWTSDAADAFRGMVRAYELRQIRPKPYAKIGHKGTVFQAGMKYNYLDKNNSRPKPHLWEKFGNHEPKRKDNYL